MYACTYRRRDNIQRIYTHEWPTTMATCNAILSLGGFLPLIPTNPLPNTHARKMIHGKQNKTKTSITEHLGLLSLGYLREHPPRH